MSEKETGNRAGKMQFKVSGREQMTAGGAADQERQDWHLLSTSYSLDLVPSL